MGCEVGAYDEKNGRGGGDVDAGTNNCRGATSSSSNEKLFVAIRADDERERLEGCGMRKRIISCVWMRSSKRGPRENIDNGDNVLTKFKA